MRQVPGGRAQQKMEMERLRREDHLRVKHDKLFSDWKILVGPADWKDHIAGEDGSQRYRIQNLPAAYFGPGVYELGLTKQHTSTPLDSKQRKLRRHAVVVVYLGQADNVRQRLQRYGQTGSHLEGTRSGLDSATEENTEQQKSRETKAKFRGLFAPEPRVDSGGGSTETSTSIQGGLRLFTEVFSRAYSIAFRWARTENKQMAEKVESELLKVFDYPWNTSLNGARRPRDILAKLDMLQYQLERSLCLAPVLDSGWRKLEYLGRKVGISVPVRKPADAPPARTKISTTFFLSSTKGGAVEHGGGGVSSVCGVLRPDGSTCSSPPVKGRRRCKDHKGQRAKASTRQNRTMPPIQQQSVEHNPVVTDSRSTGRTKPAVVIIRAQMQNKRVEITGVSTDELFQGMCGAIVGGGAPCLNRPVQGRKRCAAHKGLRTSSKSTPKAALFAGEDAVCSSPSTGNGTSEVRQARRELESEILAW